MTVERNEIRIAGTGGQGIVTAGRILAEAAVLSGSNATHSQVYGPQSRGGACRSDVVIATGEIGFPLAGDIDILMILSIPAYARYHAELQVGGRLIVDARCVPESVDPAVRRFPVVDTARAIAGDQVATGVVALGLLHAFAGLVDAEALRQAVGARVPAAHRVTNLAALDAGMRLLDGRAA